MSGNHHIQGLDNICVCRVASADLKQHWMWHPDAIEDNLTCFPILSKPLKNCSSETCVRDMIDQFQFFHFWFTTLAWIFSAQIVEDVLTVENWKTFEQTLQRRLVSFANKNKKIIFGRLPYFTHRFRLPPFRTPTTSTRNLLKKLTRKWKASHIFLFLKS